MRLLHAERLSQESKKQNQTGLESSEFACQSWSAANGHEIIHTAADYKSGTVQPWDRKNLKAWVTDPDKIALYDGVIAYRFDRLSRGDDESTSEIEAWARKHGKVLLTEDGLRCPCEGVDGIRWDVTKRIAHITYENSPDGLSEEQRREVQIGLDFAQVGPGKAGSGDAKSPTVGEPESGTWP